MKKINKIYIKNEKIIDIKALNNEINTLYDEINEYKELTKGLFDEVEK